MGNITAKTPQKNCDDFVNSLARDTIDRIYDSAGDDDKMRLDAFWNFAEIILLDAVKYSHHIGGEELAVSSLKIFKERMRNHYAALNVEADTTR